MTLAAGGTGRDARGAEGPPPSRKDTETAARSTAEGNSAIQAVRGGDRRRAEEHATRAITLAEEIEAEPIRRKEYAVLAMLLVDLGFHERGLDLAMRAVQLDHKLGDVDLLAEDLLSYGNALSRLGRIREAVEVFGQVKDLAGPWQVRQSRPRRRPTSPSST